MHICIHAHVRTYTVQNEAPEIEDKTTGSMEETNEG